MDMKMNKPLLSALLLAALLAPAGAQSPLSGGDPLAGSGPFSDPAFQDFLETSENGYLNSKNTMALRSDFREFRDALISAPAPSLKTPQPAAPRVAPEDRPGLPALPQGHYKVTFAGDSGPMGSYVGPLDGGSKRYAREYVLLGVSVKAGPYDALLPRLEAAGFKFAGEKISYASKKKATVILGWAPMSAVPGLSKVKGVEGVAVEKKGSGVPMRARVRFTLKVPYQNKPNAFVPAFIKQLSADGGFAAESWFRLPQKAADSKFSVFDVTGVLPVDMIAPLSRSPFVAAVEFHDSSL
jgi:hypothetical protein